MIGRLKNLRNTVPNLVIAQRVVDKMSAAASHYLQDETGEAMIGILLAIPIAISEDTNFFRVIREPLGSWPGLILIALVCYWIYAWACKAFSDER